MSDMNTIQLDVLVSEKVPRACVYTDAFESGTEVVVTNGDKHFNGVVFPSGDKNEHLITINPNDAAAIGMIENPSKAVTVSKYIKEKGGQPHAYEPRAFADRPTCLTADAFKRAIEEAPDFNAAFAIALDQLTALGYQGGTEVLRRRHKDE